MFLKKTYEERYVLRPLSKGRASANGMPFAERVFPGESLTRIITNPKKFIKNYKRVLTRIALILYNTIMEDKSAKKSLLM